MSRKGLLSGITASINEENAKPAVSEARSDYTRRGASKSMMNSLDDLAEASLRIRDGEVIVSLDPTLLDSSFVEDRLDDGADDFAALKSAIQANGQSSPIMVRPHPDTEGRFQIIFGHRRTRAAKELGLQVRAVIKQLADVEHIIAQGQENTQRANLSFIEKALFAKRLLERGMTKDVAKAALNVDDTLLSRMLSVADGVPEIVLNALGAAKGIGRDRWEELKKVVQPEPKAEQAIEFVGSDVFAESSDPFNALLSYLKTSGKPKKAKTRNNSATWSHASKALSVEGKAKPKGFSLELTEKDAKPFGQWLTHNLDELYETFSKSQPKDGD